MKKHTFLGIFSAVMITAFMAWGFGAFAQDPYSQGEMGVVSGNASVTASGNGMHRAITAEGYCLIAPVSSDRASRLSFEQGELGIASPFSATDRFLAHGSGSKPLLIETCMMTEPVGDSGQGTYNYSLGKFSRVN